MNTGGPRSSDRHQGEHRQRLTLTRRCRATPPFGRRGWLSGGPARCNAASVEPADARCRERPGAELSVTGPLRNGEE